LGWVHYSKSSKNMKNYVNAFKARLDKIWLHQTVKLLVVLGWVGLGPNFPTCSGLGWVGLGQLMGWVGSGLTKWTHGQLCRTHWSI